MQLLTDIRASARTVEKEPTIIVQRGTLRANKRATELIWALGTVQYALDDDGTTLMIVGTSDGIKLGGKTSYGRPLPGGRALVRKLGLADGERFRIVPREIKDGKTKYQALVMERVE